MILNSVVFIYYFLPLVVGVFWALGKWPRLQNLWLLAASLLFYVWCNTRFLFFLIAFGAANYGFGRLVAAVRRPAARRAALVAGVASNVLCLFAVKYLNFSIAVLGELMGVKLPKVTALFVPLGVSFLVFAMIAYLVDVYRGTAKPLVNVLDFFLYLSFFPKISQGPITRGEQLYSDLRQRAFRLEEICGGIRRFCVGLGKKVLIADVLGASVDLVFATLDVGVSSGIAWCGLLCYTFQIYFDFSGYTDMAIGLGTLFGFHLPENFNQPYRSKSVSEFWRRWHMTLGQWFREYVYIPLGGNRRGAARTYFNLAVVWLLTGLWHGADYTYLLWGAMLGAVIMWEKAVGKTRWYRRIPGAFKWLGTFLVIMVSWVLFRSPTFADAVRYLMMLLGAEGYTSGIYAAAYFFDARTLIALAAAILICCQAIPQTWRDWLERTDGGRLLVNVGTLALFALSLLFMVNSTYNAFIYFQF